MKNTLPEPLKIPTESERNTSDNLCKRLAEEYPAQFARWLFGARGKVKIVKTELNREPIRADSVIFSHANREILHAEFQTTLKSKVPMPLRLLDYYVGFKRQNPKRRVRQVLVVLKPTHKIIPNRYKDERTTHEFDVIEVWKQDPKQLLEHEGLLPLVTLCRAESGEKLLTEVAARIRRIKSRARRRETLNWSRVLAGLRYDKRLIYQTLKESDMLEESVVYQDIFRKGKQRGVQEGERKLALRLLERRVGKLSLKIQRQIESLPIERIEELCEALPNFKASDDLMAWLKQKATVS
jgi:predicted transposase YdaD